MDKKKTLTYSSEVKAVNVETREVLHTISTPTPDRAGDVVEPGGVALGNYRTNPVVLLDHDYSAEKIIGKGDVYVEKDRIDARTKFADTPLARDMFELVRTGFAKAWSVGFKPLEYEAMKDDKGVHRGFRFSKWELLEYSLVAVPMNPEALTAALKGFKLHPDTIRILGTPSEPAPCSVEQPAGDDPNVPEGRVYSSTVRAKVELAEKLLHRRSKAAVIYERVTNLLRR